MTTITIDPAIRYELRLDVCASVVVDVLEDALEVVELVRGAVVVELLAADVVVIGELVADVVMLVVEVNVMFGPCFTVIVPFIHAWKMHT